MMNDKLKSFFLDILSTPSPTGFEAGVMRKFVEFLKPYVDEFYTDSMGNTVAHKKGNLDKSLMIEAHADEIGLMVTYIDKDGYLYFKTLGGIDPNVLPGDRVMIMGTNGVVPGVIGRKAIHMQSAEERKESIAVDKLWIDVGAVDLADALAKVNIGDPIVVVSDPVVLNQSRVAARATDDKAGIAVVAGVAQKLADTLASTELDLYFVASTQEEIGTRGAQVIAQHIQPKFAISLDVTHSTDYHGVSPIKYADISLDKGVVIAAGPNINVKMNRMLIDLAKKAEIPYQLEAIPRATATDARTIQLVGSGVITELLSIPCRYMHTPNEVVSLDDIQSAVDLITEFCKSKLDVSEFNPVKL